jgi:hypothetical protein
MDALKQSERKAQKVRLPSECSVEWGLDESFTLYDYENTPNVITRHVEPIIGILKLGHENTKGLFISVSLANDIQVHDVDGQHMSTLTGHSGRISKVLQVSNGHLVSISEAGEIKFWDAKNQQLLNEIDANFTSHEQVNFFHRSGHLSILEKSGVGIWRFNGERVLNLPEQKSQIEQAYILRSENWLIKAKDKAPQIWNDAGKCLNTFTFTFSFDDDFIELEDNSLLIKNASETVSLYNANGECLNTHDANSTLSDIFSKLVIDDYLTRDEILQNPTIKDYKHVRNFYSSAKDLFIPAKVFDGKDVDFTGNPTAEKVWNFFNRPLFSEVKKALTEIVKRAHNSQKDLQDSATSAQSEIDASSKSLKLFGALSKIFFGLFILIGSAGAGLLAYMESNSVVVREHEILRAINSAEPEVVLITPGVVLFILFIMFFRSKRKAAKALAKFESNLVVLNTLHGAFGKILISVAKYRRDLLSQIPITKRENSGLFGGEFIREHVDGIINGKLKQIAMDECGLEKDDIISENQEPIILPAWSLIQDEQKREQAKKKLVKENELCFWPLNDGSLACAVQFIQYSFLTADKIDVFTCYYDFISNKSFAKEANAFYYKDVTNIVKRDVEREGISLSAKPDVEREGTSSSANKGDTTSNDFSANEIVLSVSSGERIRLTIINEETVSMMNASSKKAEMESREVKLKRIADEAQAIKEDVTLTEEEREEGLSQNEAEREALESDAMELSSKLSIKLADQAVKNIRSRLNTHKKEQ